VAEAVSQLGLDYLVLTMVDRDDLPDGGAAHVAEVIRRVKALDDRILVEPLVGDFQGNLEDLATVLSAEPDVFAHNVEVVERLQRPVRDARCSWERSVEVLAAAKRLSPATFTKTSLMVGTGETDDEVLEAMESLRDAEVDILTIGQYLRPSSRHLEVDRFVHPDQFAAWQEAGEKMGFVFVAAGPLVRSSYRAGELFIRNVLRSENDAGKDGVSAL
jgi:lipoic acid synthetase